MLWNVKQIPTEVYCCLEKKKNMRNWIAGLGWRGEGLSKLWGFVI